MLHQVRAHQLVLPPCEVVIKAVSEYVSSIKDLGNLDAIARDVFKQSQVGDAGGGAPCCRAIKVEQSHRVRLCFPVSNGGQSGAF